MKKVILLLVILQGSLLFAEKTKSDMQEQLPQEHDLTLKASSLEEAFSQIADLRASQGLQTYALLNDLKGNIQEKTTEKDPQKIEKAKNLTSFNQTAYEVKNSQGNQIGIILVITPTDEGVFNFVPSIPIKEGY
jgi:hypothetical protein